MMRGESQVKRQKKFKELHHVFLTNQVTMTLEHIEQRVWVG